MSGGEIGMLVLETVLRVRREFASGKAIKAIARDLRLSRKVVRKAIREPEAEFAYRRAVQPLPRLGPFQARLDELLEEDEVSLQTFGRSRPSASLSASRALPS